MKKNVLIFMGIFVGSFSIQTAAYAADRVTTISCDLDAEHSATVDKLALQFERIQGGSLGRTFEVTYVDGSSETGSIDEGVLEDRFGNPLKSVLGKPYQSISQIKAGETVISFHCALVKGIPSLRCQSQGSGEHAAYASAVLYINGKALDFRGFGNQPTCTRTVENI